MALNFARPPDGTSSLMKNSSDTTETMVTMLPHSPSHIFPGVLANMSLFAGCYPVSGLHDSRVVGNARHPFYTVLENPETIAERDNGIDIDHNVHPVEKKRRLTNEQVKSLEVSFEIESKLEPERKSHLAEELGLQPRQVAVWFQNRRARYKTKQLEREYDFLKKQFDEVCSEKDKLEAEVKRLTDLLDAQAASTRGAGGKGLRSADQEHETSHVTAQNPPEYDLQQDEEIPQAENPTQRRAHYKLSLSLKSDGAIFKKINLLREVDTSSDSDQTEGLHARMRSPIEKYVSEQYHQHALSLVDRKCSSQLPHHMDVKVEEDFDLYNEILLEDQARESMALCSNWQHDA